MRQRASIRRRMLAAFVLLALGMGLTLGLVGLFSYDRLGEYLVSWHARPVMEALIEAEQRAWEAEDRGRRNLYYGEDLAAAMHWRFLVGKQIPPAWEELPDGLHFFKQMEEFVLLVRRNGVAYALSGRTGAFQALKARLGGLLLLCAAAGLAVAVLLAVLLSRRLTRPLSRLTGAVESRDPREPAAVTPVPPDLLGLEDEVGVLARALAAREADLQRFVRRESFFTGDVSHELRTPLTVMQGGLEILELRLAALSEASGNAELMAVVERLSRTTARMSATVRTLLLLARRPEDLERGPLELSEQLRGLIRGGERGGPEKGGGERGDASLPVDAGPALLYADVADGVQAVGQKELAAIVFKNLLDNACRYTENGRVYLRLTPEMLEVRNSGRIPGDLDIFARGVRGPQADCAGDPARSGHERAAGSAGSGLGLSLALRACEHLGWRLERDRAAPKGESVFRVLFPLLRAEEGDRE